MFDNTASDLLESIQGYGYTTVALERLKTALQAAHDLGATSVAQMTPQASALLTKRQKADTDLVDHVNKAIADYEALKP